MSESNAILRLPAVRQRTGHSRSTIYAHIQKGLFPKPIRLSVRCVDWPEYEVAAINAARIADMPEGEIRALVETLHCQRQSVAS